MIESQNVGPEGSVPGRGADHIRWDDRSLICRCPDCGAPLSVRRWLMSADCWRCGISLEVVTRRDWAS